MNNSNVKDLSLVEVANRDEGIIGSEFDARMKEAVDDCYDRPVEKKPRTVTLIATITPELGPDGDCEGVVASFAIKVAKPKQNSRKIHAKRGIGGVYINEFPGDHPDQVHMDFEGGPKPINEAKHG